MEALPGRSKLAVFTSGSRRGLNACKSKEGFTQLRRVGKEGRRTSANIAASAIRQYLFTDGAVELWTSFSDFEHQAILEGEERGKTIAISVPGMKINTLQNVHNVNQDSLMSIYSPTHNNAAFFFHLLLCIIEFIIETERHINTSVRFIQIKSH